MEQNLEIKGEEKYVNHMFNDSAERFEWLEQAKLTLVKFYIKESSSLRTKNSLESEKGDCRKACKNNPQAELHGHFKKINLFKILTLIHSLRSLLRAVKLEISVSEKEVLQKHKLQKFRYK